MGIRTIICVVVAALLTAPSVAIAAQTLTFSGTLTSGNNNAGGPFAPGSANLAGATYSVELTYEPSLFTSAGNSCGVSASTYCSFSFSTTRTATEKVTVNGNTQTYLITAGSLNLNSNFNNNGTDSVDFSFQNSSLGLSLSGAFSAPAGSPNAFFPSNGVNSLVFNSFSNLALTGIQFNQSGSNYNLGANGNSATLSAAITGVVPEPATWAMMLLGFAMIGGALRRGVRKSEEKFTARIRAIASGELA